MLFKDSFSSETFSVTCVTIVHNPSGQQGDNFSSTNEYAYFIYHSPGRSIAEQLRENPKEWDQRGLRDVTGNDSLREAGKTCFYPIYIKDGKIIGFGDVCSDDFHPPINICRDDGVIEIYPVDPNGIERKWRFGRDTITTIQDQLIVNYIKNRNVWDIQRLKKHFNYKTVWQAPKYSANNYGTQLVNRMFKKQPFSYPKSLYTVIDCIEASLNKKNKGIVLDYFAGSGTTAQAINTLNLSKISLKYILVEMGSYFYTATLPRVKKSCYQIEEKNWLDGKPLTRDTGIPQIIKYMRLESYEDALSNIEFNSEETGLLSLFGDDYLIRYMLDLETEGSLLNVAAFSNPFDYKMKITGKFAFMQIEGTLPNGDRALVIWRIVTPDTVESNAALDAYFLKHRINPQDREYDVIFVNGDNNLENLRTDKEIWKVVMTETEFKRRMFEETE